MREVLAGMGSTLIKSVNARDSWVFVGRVGSEDKSLYEKVSKAFPLCNFLLCVCVCLCVYFKTW